LLTHDIYYGFGNFSWFSWLYPVYSPSYLDYTESAILPVPSTVHLLEKNESRDHKQNDVFCSTTTSVQQRAVAGMEPTLVRNLSDHRGNNLLHVLAGVGNADGLAWLCSAFGPEMQDALLDENKRGVTPVVAAIQVRP